MSAGRYFAALLASALLFTTGCEETRPRCETCGMFADTAPAWTVIGADGQFDAPKCAFRSNEAISALRFRGYYDGTEAEGEAFRFVLGSDVLGPMGRDFVPVEPEHVDAFIRDHGGEALTLSEVPARLAELP